MAYRLLCDVLEEMRKCDKTKNFAPFAGLIEEVQILGNRMETGLGAKKDLEYYEKEVKDIGKIVDKLREEAKELKPDVKLPESRVWRG